MCDKEKNTIKKLTEDIKLARYFISPPGEVVSEEATYAKLGKHEMARRLSMDMPKYNRLVEGKIHINGGIAGLLEDTLGIPCGFWLNLDKGYKKRLDRLKYMQRELGYCRRIVKLEEESARLRMGGTNAMR